MVSKKRGEGQGNFLSKWVGSLSMETTKCRNQTQITEMMTSLNMKVQANLLFGLIQSRVKHVFWLQDVNKFGS